MELRDLIASAGEHPRLFVKRGELVCCAGQCGDGVEIEVGPVRAVTWFRDPHGLPAPRRAGLRGGYPLLLRPGQEATWGELFVSSPGVFEATGFTEVSRPTARRAVMRIDFR